MEAKQNISDRREVLDKCGHFINGYFHPIPLFVSPILQYNGRSYVFHLFYMKVYIFNLNSLFFGWPLQMIICICRFVKIDNEK